uniref:Mannosylglycerate synthase n=1 Tax=Caloglossa leprieurii TaxID=76903 RepID=A0A060L3Y0_9FLOR|nr:mannosylglycerate synthase [Caloglossa leprieurii]
MALVCFPFKKEHIPTVLRNVEIATNHPNVSIVLLAAACSNDCFHEISKAIAAKSASSDPYPVPVRVEVQERLGVNLRPGKGDGMNSALRYFMKAHTLPENKLTAPLQRIHFYDADIESFDKAWITKAEEGTSLGYDVVRHYFPRSSTDAQVTWQVTKVGFALLWPRTTLPWVQQPLGGELCFTRRVVEKLLSDQRVVRQSNWGIDTLYTFVCAQNGYSLLEAYMPQGKMHALYGGLRDLKTMLCECFAAVQSLKDEHVQSSATVHRIDPPAAVPESITSKIGYDVEKSLKLLRENWSDRQMELLTLFPSDIQDGLLAASEWPEYMFMDEDAWIRAYKVYLDNFVLDDEDWRELLFKTWVARVLNYTMRHVLRGYHVAQQANTDMVMKLHMKRSLAAFDRHKCSIDIQDASSDVQSDAPPSPESDHEGPVSTGKEFLLNVRSEQMIADEFDTL